MYRDLGVRGARVAGDAPAVEVEPLEIGLADASRRKRAGDDEAAAVRGVAQAHMPERVDDALVRDDAIRLDELARTLGHRPQPRADVTWPAPAASKVPGSCSPSARTR